MDFVDKVKGFLFEPSKAFYNSREDSLIGALKYYLILVLIYSVLETLTRIFFGEMIGSMMGKYAVISGDAGLKQIIMKSIYYVLYAIPGVIISGAFLQIVVVIAGGKKGSNQTTKALVYSSTPYLLFGWIPVINIIAGMWELGLAIIGIREFQEISTERALLAVVIPYILLLLLLGVLTGAIFLPGIRIPLADMSNILHI
jgi:hypothetical protein